MATLKMLSFSPLPDGGQLVFGDGTAQALADELSAYFLGRGYKLEAGSPFAGSYGIGSNVMRVLFGAFAKRYVFNFTVQPQAEGGIVTITKGISGAMGGVIGYRRMSKELEAILTELRARFA
jgi:hypothetical protein